jgi:simple sugar transport system permease protein
VKRIVAFFERIAKMNGVVLTLLAIVSAMVVGAFIIVLSDIEALKNGDVLSSLGTVPSAYWSVVTGSFGSLRAISNTINSSTPLILCGVSVAIAFKAGLFNIGATGQMLAGGMTSLVVGFSMSGPGIIQVPLAVLAGAVGGAAYAGIAGVLKARTGAHEVITTIMLNSIAAFLVLWLLKTNFFQRPDRTDPISKLVDPAGHLPRLFGFLDGRSDLVAHAGFFVALASVAFYWWFLSKSSLGFEFRAFGLNADAAQYAGMHTKRLTVLAMVVAGSFAGMAGAAEVLGTYGYASQHRLRRDCDCAPRAIEPDRHVVRRNSLRRTASGWPPDAIDDGRTDRLDRRVAGTHRDVHRGAAPREGDLAREGVGHE